MKIEEILSAFKEGNLNINEAQQKIKASNFLELGFAKIDSLRKERTGIPEIIFGEGKTAEQICAITKRMYDDNQDILVTRTKKEVFEEVKKNIPEIKFNELAKTISHKFSSNILSETYICVVTAGTSDIPIAEEAAITAEFLGNKVERVFDVGVAGIHRLFDKLELIRNARVIIVVAGMEGALASVIGGLVAKPIIAVPTSIGYGANFGGIAALLSMLNSCASGVSVVNIDNGFGAACQASLINNTH